MIVIRRKTLLVSALVLLLMGVAYVNHQLNEQSLLSASSEYEKYEKEQLSEVNNSEEDNSVATNVNKMVTQTSSVSIVDSKDSANNDIKNLTQETNKNIENTIEAAKRQEEVNYFVEYRVSRDQLRSSLIERLNRIIDNENTTEEVRSLAQKEILRLGDLAESELHIEGLIKGKGFEDVIVFLKEDSVRIIVDVKQLTEQDVMKILEIAKNETNIDPMNIKIMKKY